MFLVSQYIEISSSKYLWFLSLQKHVFSPSRGTTTTSLMVNVWAKNATKTEFQDICGDIKYKAPKY